MDHDDGHRYFEGLAVAHVLGGLDDSEGRVFRAHLLECSSCRARVGELRAIAHDLADVERDERRVRAAQAIDTKRREAEEDVDDSAEVLPSPRSSRITVIVGLVMILGLSLWNFTLRATLERAMSENGALTKAGVIVDSGQAWTITRRVPEIDGSVKVDDGTFVLTMKGLDNAQLYGVYAQTATGAVAQSWTASVLDGRVYYAFDLPDDAERIVVTNPNDSPDNVAKPGGQPSGAVILEARRPGG